MIRIYSLKMDRELNEGERQQALDILTPERKAKALRFRRFEDQSKGIGTGLLEAYALQQMGVDVHSCQMKHGEQGKPYIEEHPGVFYNLSHSGHWIVCAVGTQNLGIDIEQESKYKEGVVIRCFPEEEGKILMEEEPEKRPGVFAAYWTMKESFDATLCGRIGSLTGSPYLSPDRGNIKNTTGMFMYHMRNNLVTVVEYGGKIGLQNLVPAFRCQICQEADG